MKRLDGGGLKDLEQAVASEATAQWKKFGLEALDGSEPGDRKWQTVSFKQDERLLPPVRTGATVVEGGAAETAPAPSSKGGIGLGGMDAGAGAPLESPKKFLLEICRCLDLLNASEVDADVLVKAAHSTAQRALDAVSVAAADGPRGPGALSSARPPRKPDQDDQTVRVTNLPDFVTQEALEVLFNRIGDVQRTFLVRNKETHVSRGFAFITFRNKADAQKAIDKLNGKGFQGSALTVECARRKAE